MSEWNETYDRNRNEQSSSVQDLFAENNEWVCAACRVYSVCVCNILLLYTWFVRVSSLFSEIAINSIYLLIYFIILSFGHTFDLRFGHKFLNHISRHGFFVVLLFILIPSPLPLNSFSSWCLVLSVFSIGLALLYLLTRTRTHSVNHLYVSVTCMKQWRHET